jgi:hypothetical protein
MRQPTLVLISGYARAGKDTLADGIIAGSSGSHRILRRNFADSLKLAGNNFLSDVGLYVENTVDFKCETFKIRHRDMLVALGAGARSINASVFADLFVNACMEFEIESADEGKPPLVLCSDFRYLNELRIPQARLAGLGWRIITVMVETAGVIPANEEEGVSIGQIVREVPVDFSYAFRPNSGHKVYAEGKQLAGRLGV